MRILIVNDEPVQKYLIASLLQQEGYEVMEAENGLEAVEILENGFDPHLVITDLYMPGLDGWQLCRYIREKGSSVPILVISAFFEVKEIAEILKALGVDDFLRSPIQRQELLSKVKDLLEGKSSFRKGKYPLLVLSKPSSGYSQFVSPLKRAGFELHLASHLEEAKAFLRQREYPLALISSEFSPDDLLVLKHVSPGTSLMVFCCSSQDNQIDPFRFVLKGARHIVPAGSSPEFLIYLIQRELKEQALLLGQELLRQKTKELEEVSQELHRVQNVLKTVVEQATDIGIVVTDARVNPFFANQKAREFFALSEEKDFWGLLRILFGRPDVTPVLEAIEHQGSFHCEIRVPGQETILSLKVRPLRDKKGLSGYVFFLEDLTKERELQNRLVQMQKMEAVATLAAGIAHDFNNLLAAIRLKAELLQDKIGDQFSCYLSDIVSICDRAAQVVRQIISFSQPTMASEISDLNEQVREALEFLKETIPRGIRLQVELFSGALPINMDPGKISQIIMNLCLNAVQAMGEEGTLCVRTGKESFKNFTPRGFIPGGSKVLQGDFVWLEVKDTGCGIRPEHLPKIFDPYFTTKTDQAGTGLGLAVTFGLISKAGGCIAVKTSPEQGTTFSIYLPLAEEIDLQDLLPPPVTKWEKARLLVVEDEFIIRESMSEYLHKLGYEVHFCENGKQALSFLEKDLQPDVLVLDLNLPGIPGVEIARRFKEKWQDIHILITSGYVAPKDQQILHRLGVDDILLKPFSLDYLHESLQRILASEREGAHPNVS